MSTSITANAAAVTTITTIFNDSTTNIGDAGILLLLVQIVKLNIVCILYLLILCSF